MKRKRILSVLLVLCLLAALPNAALAEGSEEGSWRSVSEPAEAAETDALAEAPADVPPWYSAAVAAEAAQGVAAPLADTQGTCGASLTWSFTAATGTLTIRGTGAMWDYGSTTAPPWYPIQDSIRTLMIASGATSIGQYAFYDCIRLSNITIPGTVTEIESQAFYDCDSLQNVTLPYGVNVIRNSAFRNCSSLQGITLPNSLTYIEGYVFADCGSLQSIAIPNSVTCVGTSYISSVFENCSKLQSVTLPNRLERIESSTFWGCSSLQSITIPGSVLSIGNYAFYDCRSLRNITLPVGLTRVADGTFSDCSSLQSIVIPAGVLRIGEYAFSRCTSLQNVTLPNDVLRISQSAFRSCSALTSIVLPQNLIDLGESAFAWCRNLTTAQFTGNAPGSFGSEVFDDCASGFKIYYDPATSGWSTPTWNGYPAYPNGSAPLATPVLALAHANAGDVGLTWGAIPGAMRYSVYRGTGNETPAWYASTANPWYIDTAAFGGARYTYTVLAAKGSGANAVFSARSNAVAAQVAGLGTPVLTLARAEAGNIGLTWNAVPGATGYSVYKGTGGACSWYANAANPWYTDTAANLGTTYTYQVMAYKRGAATTYGARSAVKTVTPALGAPSLAVAYAGVNHTGLTWNAIPGATGYSVYRGTGAGLDWYAGSANPWFIDTQCRPGTTYSYQVFAYRSAGGSTHYGPRSAVKSAAVPALPTPTVSAVRATPGNVGLTWGGTAGARYSIYRGADPIALTLYADSANPWFSDRNTAAGTTYYYQVMTYLRADGQTWYSEKSAAVPVSVR